MPLLQFYYLIRNFDVSRMRTALGCQVTGVLIILIAWGSHEIGESVRSHAWFTIGPAADKDARDPKILAGVIPAVQPEKAPAQPDPAVQPELPPMLPQKERFTRLVPGADPYPGELTKKEGFKGRVGKTFVFRMALNKIYTIAVESDFPPVLETGFLNLRSTPSFGPRGHFTTLTFKAQNVAVDCFVTVREQGGFGKFVLKITEE